jgi:hypothetical protein
LSVVPTTMMAMTGQQTAAPGQGYRPLETADLFDGARDGDLVRLSLRLTRVAPRRTPAGLGWAVLHGTWRGREVRCVAFPKQWAEVPDHPSVGDGVVVRGILSFRDGEASVRVLHLARIGLVQPVESRGEE